MGYPKIKLQTQTNSKQISEVTYREGNKEHSWHISINPESLLFSIRNLMKFDDQTEMAFSFHFQHLKTPTC